MIPQTRRQAATAAGHRGAPRRATAAVVAAAALAALLAGCSDDTPKVPAQAAAAAPIPQGVQDPAVIPSAAADAGCANPTSSYAPLSPMPAPGKMPAGSTMAKIQARGRLIVGVDQNTYLFGYLDPNSGVIQGFDIDMAHAMAKAIFGDPSKIQFVAITSAERIPYVQKGTVDMVADTMTINCDRWRQVAFSDVYYQAGQSVLVAKTSTARSIADLGGQKVCAAAGSTSITNIAQAKSKPIPVSVNDWTDCLVMLQQGQVAAISTDDTILRGLAAQDPNTKLVGGDFTDEPYGLAFAQGNVDLVKFANGVLAQMRGDGAWASIYDKWLGGPAPAPPSPAPYKNPS